MDERADSSVSSHEKEAIHAADRVVGESRGMWALRFTGRLAGRALGIVFIAAGLLKALSPQLFHQEITQYGIVTEPVLVALIAYSLILVELALGSALLVNLKPRLTIPLAILLLLFFLSVVGWAWATGATENCGCFGPWKRSPAEAFLEDLLLLGAAGWAWWGRLGTLAPTNTLKLVAVGVGVFLGLTVPAVSVMVQGMTPGSAGVAGSTAFATIETEDLAVDLAHGEHLVLLMSTECQHCRDAVPEVNALVGDPRLPKLVALAAEDRVERGLFGEDYKAQYPIGQISTTTLASLMGKQFPRLFLVREGTIVAVWDSPLPSADEILQAETPPA